MWNGASRNTFCLVMPRTKKIVKVVVKNTVFSSMGVAENLMLSKRTDIFRCLGSLKKLMTKDSGKVKLLIWDIDLMFFLYFYQFRSLKTKDERKCTFSLKDCIFKKFQTETWILKQQVKQM